MSTSTTINGSVRQWKRYEPRRATGVSWLGDIPQHWHTKRIKHICQMNPSKSEIRGMAEDVPVSFLPMEKVSERGGLDLELSRPLGVVWQGFTYFRDGDVLVAKITPCFENGKGALAQGLENGIGFGTTELHVLRAKPLIDSRFLELLTRQHAFRNLGCTSMTGVAGQQRVSEAFISNYVVGIPPLDEQRRIVAFLDRETAKIDALIAKKERLIELLQEKRTALISHAVTKGLDPTVPMKESGVEWLGKIPCTWHVKRLKFCLYKMEQGWSPSCENRMADEHEWGVMKVGCVNGNEFDPTENKALPADLEPLPELELRPGDVLMSRANTRELLGSSSVVRQIRPRLLLCDKLYRLRRRPSEIDGEFLVHALGSRVSRYQLEREATGASGSMQNIAQSIVWNLTIALPSLSDQGRIIDYIQRESTQIDRLIAKVKNGIDKLREYRTALISAAVTGKIDVREEVA